ADGRVKMFVANRALGVRGQQREVYEQGDYVPLQTSGTHRDCLFAFARRAGDTFAITAVPRLIASLVPDATAPPLGREVWTDTRIELPPGSPAAFRDTFTGSTIASETGEHGA